ncbi:MAG: AbrB/MazE/SpoVT family DNA-binding domain-containing protein [Desulfobacterales bacterium]|nr:AbrB/MazE/SpoVT family DNA-binding domain-containing protein [Desulfobacterales bacterium]
MPKVTSKGQVTIPRRIRSILSIRAGDDVVFEMDSAKVVLRRKSASMENLKKYVGFLTHLEGEKTDDIIDGLRGEANDSSR